MPAHDELCRTVGQLLQQITSLAQWIERFLEAPEAEQRLAPPAQ